MSENLKRAYLEQAKLEQPALEKLTSEDFLLIMVCLAKEIASNGDVETVCRLRQISAHFNDLFESADSDKRGTTC